MESTDSFFDQPPGGDSDGMVVNGRYAIKHPDTGRPETWQRASNFAAPLSDHHAIARWQMRELIRGLNLREDLLELIRTAAEISNAQADAWIKSAHEAAATDAKANRGTAVHEVLRAYDAGQQYSERYAHIVSGYGRELDRQRLTPVGWEVVVLNTALGAAGRLDRVYREADGSYVLGDVKTGRLDYAIHDFAVQCAVYNTSKYLVDDAGVPRPLPWVLRQDYAVLIHVDPITGESSTYRLDMTLGRRAANLAVQVREWRNTKGVALPYVPPDEHAEAADALSAAARVVEVDAPPAGLAADVQSAAQLAVADVRARSNDLGYAPDAPLTPEHVARVNAGIGPGRTLTVLHTTQASAMPAGTVLDRTQPHYDTAIGEQRIRPDGVTVHFTGRDWEALNEVQRANLAVPGEDPRAGMDAAMTEARALMPHPTGQLAKDAVRPEPPAIDPEVEAAELAKRPKAELQRMLKDLGGKDLAHHRSWLANEIVKRKNADGSQPVTVGAPAPAHAPAAEQTPHTLSLIGAAMSVADISRLREKIVAVGGDQAWTDEMTEAARDRVTELDEGDRQSVLARIDCATGSQELAALWAELTLSGTAPSHWADEYQQRAAARLDVINATATAAPPVNPFEN